LELNGTWSRQAKDKGENFEPIWLKNNDFMTLEIDLLGKLENKVLLSENNISILNKKKNVNN